MIDDDPFARMAVRITAVVARIAAVVGGHMANNKQGCPPRLNSSRHSPSCRRGGAFSCGSRPRPAAHPACCAQRFRGVTEAEFKPKGQDPRLAKGGHVVLSIRKCCTIGVRHHICLSHRAQQPVASSLVCFSTSTFDGVSGLFQPGRRIHPLGRTSEHDLRARWDNGARAHGRGADLPVHVLGAVCGVTPDGSIVDVPSASQRRLLGLLAVHAPRQLRGVACRRARRLNRSAQDDGVAPSDDHRAGHAAHDEHRLPLEGDVDAMEFCSAVANASRAVDKLGALEMALTLSTGPALEEFHGTTPSADRLDDADDTYLEGMALQSETVDGGLNQLVASFRGAPMVLGEALCARAHHRLSVRHPAARRSAVYLTWGSSISGGGCTPACRSTRSTTSDITSLKMSRDPIMAGLAGPLMPCRTRGEGLLSQRPLSD